MYLMQTPADMDSQKHVYFLTLILAISGWFIEYEGRFLINFAIIKKINYNLRTLYHTRGNTKGVHVSSDSGATIFSLFAKRLNLYV